MKDQSPRQQSALAASAPPAEERAYYSISEAAALLGVSRVSIWRWIRAGRLPVARLGHRTTRITRRHLDGLLGQLVPASAGSRGNGSDGATSTDGAESDGAAAEQDAELEHSLRIDWRAMGPSEHFVQFYEADHYLLDAVAKFIAAALDAGDAGIVVATPAHREGVAERLAAAGLDLAAARADGRYVVLDAAETLATFTVAGTPDGERFAAILGTTIDGAAQGGRRVRIFGEMVALLAEAGEHAAALRLEALWNDLQQAHSFSLFCAYPMIRLDGEAFAAHLDDVCSAHSRVIPAESYNELPTAEERLRAIAALQQKARWLETEIAERQEAEERLRAALAAEHEARAAAEVALAQRDEFVSIAAHELRTPLTALRGYAQLALRRVRRGGALDPEWLGPALQAIADQSGKLSLLVGQLLDLSRLEAGKLSLGPEPTDLAALVTEVVAGIRTWNDRHVITLDLPAALQVRVDALRLEQVLMNLLDNAVKFSPGGERIEVTMLPLDGAVELSVRDHGLGIPPERRGQIFERFYQAHDNGHGSGMGLGLYISRQIVALHGGEIHAEFPPDGGTRFVVRLPIEVGSDGLADESLLSAGMLWSGGVP